MSIAKTDKTAKFAKKRVRVCMDKFAFKAENGTCAKQSPRIAGMFRVIFSGEIGFFANAV
ncbi:MAG: hypothetical protein LBB59_08670 [Campylobacteraceae bacterium]|jgi:hypothetical protein|nr:hypothetical protein [Campylobacteraceae bacterium]